MDMCTRSKRNFEEMEIITGSCQYESCCEFVGGCPLKRYIAECDDIAKIMDKYNE